MNDKISQTEQNLQRKLDWISRADTRIGFTASVAVAMLGVLATASAALEEWSWYFVLIFGAAFGLLFASLILIYLSQYPKMRSSNSSLIYFGTIAKLKVDEFKRRVRAETEDEYLDDLLFQTHTNAQILDLKFKYLKGALILIFISILPWLSSIYISKIYIK